MICPICKEILSINEKGAFCPRNHCFDRAKEGYINLLTVGEKNSVNPGDSKEMVLARRDFFRGGYYEKLSDRINAIVSDLLTTDTIQRGEFLDVNDNNDDFLLDKNHSNDGEVSLATDNNKDLTLNKNHSNDGEVSLATDNNKDLALNKNLSNDGEVSLVTDNNKDLTLNKNHSNDGEVSLATDNNKDLTLNKNHSNDGEVLVSDIVGKDIANAHLMGDDKKVILDAGCSVGYYASRAREYLQKQDIALGLFLGLDISKEAVKVAAKADKMITYIVASIYDVPLKKDSVDLAVSVFAPLSDSLYSVIKNGGYLLCVIPGENHLLGLKKALYETVLIKKERLRTFENMTIIHSEKLSYEIRIRSSNDIKNLLLMTPYYFKSPRESVERVIALNELCTEVDFEIICLKKDKETADILP